MVMAFFRRFLSKLTSSMPQTNGRIYLDAPIKPISINRDQHGVVYIFAETRTDLFFGQGFVHAQDRLWQMELNRRAAHGTLSELFGKRTLHTDRLARTLGFSRLAKTTVSLLSTQAQTDLQAYTDGVNTFINSRSKRPFELYLLNHTPTPWQIIDSVAYGRLQMWALTTGASSELIYVQLRSAVGEEKAKEWGIIYPPENPITLPYASDLIQRLRLDKMLNGGDAGTPFLGKGSSHGRGSNGWVVGKALTNSNQPLLANDMHLPMSIPSTWHLQHLQSDDGFKAAGFTQPGLPYIMIGHNEHIAWGATMAYTDGEDLFIEQFDAKRPFDYKVKNEWKPAQQFRELIKIRGQKPHLETVMQTHHGPIVSGSLIERSNPHKIALASVALTPELTMDGFGKLNEAKNWFDFQTAVSRIQAPSLNLLYADRNGNIGAALTGKQPIRPKGRDGTMPNEGWHGKHDWQGLVPIEQMPFQLNPPNSKIISANHKIVPDTYPVYLGKMWRNGYRAKRIAELLADDTAVSPQKCRQIQLDDFSIPAQKICSYLIDLKPKSPLAQGYLKHLHSWDFRMSTRSIETTIFQIFISHLMQEVARSVPAPLQMSLFGLGPHENLQPVNDFQGQFLTILLNMLENPESKWLKSTQKNRILEVCLEKTAVSLEANFGKNPEDWRWGKHHQITLKHPLGIVKPLSNLLNIGPIPISGDGYTVHQTSMHPHTVQNFDFQNNAISVSTRMIADLSDWNQFEVIHASGQSGHWQSPHYADLVALWKNGRFIKMPWEKSAIKSKMIDSLLLLPQKQIIK